MGYATFQIFLYEYVPLDFAFAIIQGRKGRAFSAHKKSRQQIATGIEYFRLDGFNRAAETEKIYALCRPE